LWPLGIGLALLLVLAGVWAMVRKARRKPPADSAGELNLLENSQPALPAPLAGQELAPTQEHALLAQARTLTQQNPVAVAHIVKTWMHGEEAA